MRTLATAPLHRLLTLFAVAATLGLAGCGGSQVEYQEVPGAPAEITLPESEPAEDAAAEDDAAADEEAPADEATPEPTATPTPAADADTDGTTDESTTQAEAPAAAEDGPASDEPPVPGTDAERFEDFCEQNAGAC